ncbi:hypothetical protein TNCT_91861 [Trichonephila clavata]|uniref:Uncharacterized protein n=1 Tax=Trichonephila clavata TaxID=2740835 RepID=A0A8X6GIA4_TRICU|nr:hypothetical protein TNCT_91861 [Trichonephila clavata]
MSSHRPWKRSNRVKCPCLTTKDREILQRMRKTNGGALCVCQCSSKCSGMDQEDQERAIVIDDRSWCPDFELESK